MITIFFIAYLQATRKQQQQHGQHSLVRVPAAAVVVAIVVTSCRYCCCCYCSAVVVFCLFFFVPLSILFARRNFSALSIFPAIISGSSSLSSLHPFPLSSLHLLMVLTVLVSFCNIYRLAIYFSFSLLQLRRAAELPICLPFCDSLCRPHGVVEGCLRDVVARTVANDTKQRLWQSFITCPAAAATGHH